jgi:hypothetical protein
VKKDPFIFIFFGYEGITGHCQVIRFH